MPNGPYGKRAPIIRAEEQAADDLRPCVARCLHCPKWSHTGTAAECRAASASHRKQYHPGARQTKRRRGNVSRFNPGLVEDRNNGLANAAEVAALLAKREAAA